MPVKRTGILTGVPSAAVVKAAREGVMSQDIELELAAIEAEVGELEQLMAVDKEKVDASDQDSFEDAQEDANLMDVDKQGALDTPSAEPAMNTAASEAVDYVPASLDDVPDTQPALSEAAAADAQPDDGTGEGHPNTELTAKQEPGQEVAPATAASGGKKPAMGLKRKGFAAPRAAANTEPKTAPSAPDARPAPSKKMVKGRPAPPVEEVDMGGKENAAKQTHQAPVPATANVKPPATKLSPSQHVNKASTDAGDGPELAAIKLPKKPLNAYMMFISSARAQVKDDCPELNASQITAKLGEMYRALNPVEKKPHEEAAAADKKRYETELAAMGPEAVQAAKAAAKPKGGKKEAKEAKAKAAKTVRTKSAYQLFFDNKMPSIREQNPKAGMPEISKCVSTAWKECSDEDKASFIARAKELKEAAKEAAAAATTDSSPVAPKPQKAAPKRGAAGRGSSSKRAKGSTGTKAATMEPACDDDGLYQADDMEAAITAGEDCDDEAERMACDWAAHPAEYILGETSHGKYLVMRSGLGFTEYGLVDAAAVKAQRLGVDPTAPACPVTLDMLEEYEQFHKRFRAEVHANTDDHGELVLESLPAGSLLESCFYLGQLRESSYPLNRAKKGDPMMKVPLMGTCSVVQRMLVVERARSQQLLADNRALQGQVMELQAQVADSGAAATGKAAAVQEADSPGTLANKTAEA